MSTEGTARQSKGRRAAFAAAECSRSVVRQFHDRSETMLRQSQAVFAAGGFSFIHL
jgi:phosphoribosylformylglycinamidine (FGAM) synthase-like amidotransferase family enzyme